MKNLYRYVGIGLFVVSLVLLIPFLKFLLALSIFQDFYSILQGIISEEGIYGMILFYLFMSLDTLFAFFGIVLSIILIKRKKYSKHLLYWVYASIAINTLSFILYVPLKIYIFADLVIAVLAYLFLIHHDNNLSRIIKGKAKQ